MLGEFVMPPAMMSAVPSRRFRAWIQQPVVSNQSDNVGLEAFHGSEHGT